jgi:hypothetical protein
MKKSMIHALNFPAMRRRYFMKSPATPSCEKPQTDDFAPIAMLAYVDEARLDIHTAPVVSPTAK